MKILYICTHNRCRSILSEALTRHFGAGVLQAESAGSQPVGEVHPLSIKYLQEQGISTEGLTSESWNDKAAFNPDLVVTVCDSAAGETCPLWMGDSLVLHWGLPDPSKLKGTDEEIKQAFYQVMETIKQRVHKLVKVAQSEGDKEEALRALIATHS